MWHAGENEGKSALCEPLLSSVAAVYRESKCWMFLVAMVCVARGGTWRLKRTKIQLSAHPQDPTCSMLGHSLPTVSLSVVI